MFQTGIGTTHGNQPLLPGRTELSAVRRDVSHPHDRVEDAIAHSVYRGVTGAIERFFKEGKQTRLRELLVDAFAGVAEIRNFGSDAHPNPGVQINVPPKVKGMELPVESLCIRITGEDGPAKASYGGGIITIALDKDVLHASQSFTDPPVQRMLTRFGMQLHHEAVHISSGAVSPDNYEGFNPYLNPTLGEAKETSAYNEGKINYYTDPGELRAHAKQHAFLFHTFYGPSEAFDIDKMVALLPLDPKIERFFAGLTESGESKIWGMNVDPYVDRLCAAHAQFASLFHHFCDLLRSRP